MSSLSAWNGRNHQSSPHVATTAVVKQKTYDDEFPDLAAAATTSQPAVAAAATNGHSEFVAVDVDEHRADRTLDSNSNCSSTTNKNALASQQQSVSNGHAAVAVNDISSPPSSSQLCDDEQDTSDYPQDDQSQSSSFQQSESNNYAEAENWLPDDEDPWHKAMKKMEEEQKLRSKIGLVVNGRFRIVSKLAFGSYGSIFIADDTHAPPDSPPVAVKFETPLSGSEHLAYEHKVYQVIQGGVGIPRVLWHGQQYEHNILVMNLLGPPLDQLFTFCQTQFSVVTLIKIARQMLTRLRHVHQSGFIHRDIKPENFLIGLFDEADRIFLIDYGLARRYRFRDTTGGEGGGLKHIPFRKGKNLVGTARFTSINCHRGFETSRRDDLESLCYVLIHFARGRRQLPWQETQQQNRRKHRTKKQLYNRIRHLKETTSIADLCDGCPPCLARMLAYSRQLEFEAQPNYDYLLGLLQTALAELGVQDDRHVPFDWQHMAAANEHDRFAFDCTFRWTLPRGMEPRPPAQGVSTRGSRHAHTFVANGGGWD